MKKNQKSQGLLTPQRGLLSSGIGKQIAKFVVFGSSLPPHKRRMVYLGLLLCVLSVIWTPIGLFVAFIPQTFVSRWDLILPGAGTGHAVSLESIGQASATSSSPFTSHSIDPKVNYKAVVQSFPVLSAAAESVGMTVENFGKPRIKLVDQTALMHFRISASNAELAYKKSIALYNALQNELERLRADELTQREKSVQIFLQGYHTTLSNAQKRILEFQAKSQIVSEEQFPELAKNLEKTRIKLDQLKAEYANVKASRLALQNSLNTNANLAASIHTLQHDALFQHLANQWSQTVATLSKKRNLFGKHHPQVIQASTQQSRLKRSLHKRALSLVRDTSLNKERLIAIGSSDASLYTQLVELNTRESGISAQIMELEMGIKRQSEFLEKSTTDASTLEELRRKQQVATAVLTTALAKLDISKSDRFSSYPLVQLLAQPTIPDKPETLAVNVAVVSGLLGSFSAIIGLFLLWNRKPYLQKLLKNA